MGAITVELQAKAIPGFDQYMMELTPWGNARNPWFSEYWQEWFDCQLQANLLQQQRLASGGAPPSYSRRAALGAVVGPSGNGAVSARQTAAGSSEDDSVARSRRSLAAGSNCGGRGNASTTTTTTGQGGHEPTTPTATTSGGQCSPPAGTNDERRTKRRANFELSLADDEASRAVKQFCSPNLRISESNGYRQEQKVQFVVDAVYAMAHALHKAWSHLCGAQPGVVCEALKELNGE